MLVILAAGVRREIIGIEMAILVDIRLNDRGGDFAAFRIGLIETGLENLQQSRRSMQMGQVEFAVFAHDDPALSMTP
ncbi:MAG: hypothetical protein CVU17_08900 [Betaproteobacteria bacterium HGW-Betaproteobacteria-11]|nr:MAG: hypothetical protein CVU17_08900 [Betaproteobacteria bacterium HGW-Betaproteobacteria-11]